ncbi:MAG TPA: PilN domain-containing protein, partial [Vicinamibacterales bacterium]|nr:PilN domain-containing protein [Vicinamibacterales bacterium]
MIRINLLGVERQKARKAPAFDIGQRVTLACSLILVAAALGIGWWYWSLNEQSERLDADIAAARQEAARLQSLLEEVKRFEAQRAQLQQRVTLIEQLRRGQSIPVQLLDHVSRSVPDMLWLTELRQEGAEVTIEGRSTTLIGVSDFIGNLAAGELL